MQHCHSYWNLFYVRPILKSILFKANFSNTLWCAMWWNVSCHKIIFQILSNSTCISIEVKVLAWLEPLAGQFLSMYLKFDTFDLQDYFLLICNQVNNFKKFKSTTVICNNLLMTGKITKFAELWHDYSITKLLILKLCHLIPWAFVSIVTWDRVWFRLILH